jgi:hypothetical protein
MVIPLWLCFPKLCCDSSVNYKLQVKLILRYKSFLNEVRPTSHMSNICVEKKITTVHQTSVQYEAIRDLWSGLHEAYLQLSRNEDKIQSVKQTVKLRETHTVGQAGFISKYNIHFLILLSLQIKILQFVL